MIKNKKKREPQVLKYRKHQIGDTLIKADALRVALPSGKRKSKEGKIYYEYRKNRSDLKGKLI